MNELDHIDTLPASEWGCDPVAFEEGRPGLYRSRAVAHGGRSTSAAQLGWHRTVEARAIALAAMLGQPSLDEPATYLAWVAGA